MSISSISYSGMYILPVQDIDITKDYQTTADGRKLGVSYSINVNGTLSARRGSPKSDGSFSLDGSDTSAESPNIDDQLGSIIRKQKALTQLFSNEGAAFRVQSPSAASGLLFYPRTTKVSFPAGLWLEVCPYTISLTADRIYGPNGEYDTDVQHGEFVSSASENWALNNLDTPYTYELKHTISAVGKRVYISGKIVNQPFEYARSFCLNQLRADYITSGVFSPNAGSGIFADSAMFTTGFDMTNLNLYNEQREEVVDETEGSYSLTQTWILSSGGFIENYNINVSNFYENENRAIEVSIQGNIIGLSSGLNTFNQRYTAANNAWEGYVKNQLYSRASGVALGYTLNTLPNVVSTDRDILRGTINYQTSYDDRLTGTSGVKESYTIDKRQSLDDFRSIVSVNGSIVGRGSGVPADRYDKAEYAYNQLKFTGFYNRAVRYSQVSGLLSRPYSASFTASPNDGAVSYQIEFTNRDPDAAFELYTVSKNYSRENGVTTVSIQGDIEGYATNIYDVGVQATGAQITKYANASSYYIGITGQLYTRAVTYSNTSLLTSLPIVTLEAHNPVKGTVSYQYDYNTIPLPSISGALSEIINIGYTSPGEVFASIPIPGRANRGPITQDINTLTSRAQTISMEVLMPIPTGTLLQRISQKPDPWAIISGIEPTGVFRSEPVENWNPSNGRYTFQRAYLYKS